MEFPVNLTTIFNGVILDHPIASRNYKIRAKASQTLDIRTLETYYLFAHRTNINK